MILRGTNEEQLTIDLVDRGPAGTPEAGDLQLDVSVVVGGFRGAQQPHVLAADWSQFMLQLRTLERTRRGHAILVGASPDDFVLRFDAVDALGHLSVTGAVVRREFGGLPQRLTFGFSFDPGMLAAVVRELTSLAR